MSKLKLIKYMAIVIVNIMIIYYYNKLILLDNRAFELLDSNIRLNYNVLYPLLILLSTLSYNIYKEIHSNPKKIIHYIYIGMTLLIIVCALTKGLYYLRLTLLILGICLAISNNAIEKYIYLNDNK